MKSRLKVGKIELGLVLDHLKPYANQKAQQVLEIENFPALIIRDCESSRYGRKDILKVEAKNESELEKILKTVNDNIPKLAFLSKNCTVSVIKNGKIIEKYKVTDKLREYLKANQIIEGVFKCKNYNCITNKEKGVISKFWINTSNGSYEAKCYYCEEYLSEKEIEEYII